MANFTNKKPLLFLCAWFWLLLTDSFVFAQLNADFKADLTSGCAPLVIQFTNLSTGNPDSLFWDFGNGNSSSQTNPGAIYSSPGIYTVTLIAFKGIVQDTLIKNGYIIAYAPPIGNFSANKKSGCAPFTVNFTDLSIPTSSSIVEWYWDFGDGNKSNLKNPTHTYATGGVFTVYLIVKDAIGCQDIFFIDKYIKVGDPIASFTAPASACMGSPTINFMNTSSGNNLTYLWDFGDGNTGTQQNPTHTYFSAVDTHIVRLSITDDLGCTDTVSQDINIIDFTADFSYTINCADDSTDSTFTINLFDVSGAAFRHWDFGDSDTSNIQNPIHKYDTVQSYKITFVASDGECIDTIEKTYIPPTAIFTMDTFYNCESPLTVSFTNFSIGTDSLSFFWNLGDSTTSTDTNAIHTYSLPYYLYYQEFYVSLIVRNKFGCADTLYDSVVINRPAANFEMSDSSGCAPLFVQFSDISSSLEPITNWFWDFGNGDTSTLQTPPSQTYNPGDYFVRLIIINSKGCSDTIVQRVRAGVKPDSVFIEQIPSEIVDTYPYDTICHHRLVSYIPTVIYNDTNIKANHWCWEFHLGYYNEWIDDPGRDPQFTCVDSGNYEVHHAIATIENPVKDYDDHFKYCYWLNYNGWLTEDTTFTWTVGRLLYTDTIALSAGYNGCYDTTYRTLYIQPPTAVPAYIFPKGICALAACSAPESFGFYNGSVLWDTLLFYTITHQQSGLVYTLDSLNTPLGINTKYSTDRDSIPDLGNWDSSTVAYLQRQVDSVKKTFITFPYSGNYLIEISVKNDSTGCVDSRHRLLTIDSVHNGFTTNPKTSCLRGDSITFKDTSVSFFGTIVQWYWEFGDGDILTNAHPDSPFDYPFCYNWSDRRRNCTNRSNGNDTIRQDTGFKDINHFGRTFGFFNNPTHIYNDTGTYVIKSTISVEVPYRISGAITWSYYYCFYDKYDTIRIEGIKLGFTVNDTVSCPDDVFVFTDTSASTSIITQWQWEFGDTQTSAISNPVHSYANPGIYTVSLSITDANGCTDSLTKKNLIRISLPNADFTMNDTLCAGDSVFFVNNSKGDSIICKWDFGDNSPLDYRFNPNHLFAPGSYLVKLMISDSIGCADTMSNPVIVIAKPIAEFTADTFQSECQPLIVNFIDKSIGNNLSYWWDFGDGGTATVKNPTHIYTANGKFDVSLAVTNSFGCTDDTLISPFISIDGPYGTFTILQDTICYPDSVTFIANTQNSGYYIWDFGDGILEALNSSQTTDTIQHFYSLSGNFIPTLLLYDDKQQCPYLVPGTSQVVIQKIDADFNPAVLFFCTLDTVDFYNTSSSLFPIQEYKWDWGDGTTDSTGNNFITHYYDSTGTYNISYFVKDIFGCTDTVMKSISVNESPQLQIHPSDTVGCVPLSINFMANSQMVNLPDTSWKWDFGDGTVGNGDTIFHSFSKDGYFTVQLKVNYAQGGCFIDSAFAVEAVVVPKAEFEIFPLNTNCLTNSRFYFKNNSSNGLSYRWDFGNDSIADSENPDYLYPDSGKYSVKLIAYNKLGCADSAIVNLIAFDNSAIFTAPNVFTPYPLSPNQNDVFEIPGLPDNSSIRIYNRWGEKVFEENPYQNKWDGRDMKTNQPLEAGVYFYLLNFCGDKAITGFVHLLREERE